ncbi:hypothetical protein PENTCL1PPCAC_522, partial [Pristionchus entomophagus]
LNSPSTMQLILSLVATTLSLTIAQSPSPSPIPPISIPSPSTPPCDGFKCPDDQDCELQNVQCIAPPCNPVPTCVPDRDECNPKCPAGQNCQHDRVYCMSEPCPATTPRCVPDTDSNSLEN